MAAAGGGEWGIEEGDLAGATQPARKLDVFHQRNRCKTAKSAKCFLPNEH